jgi:septal ring factor EnvC (AmiA/AmiB activator)
MVSESRSGVRVIVRMLIPLALVGSLVALPTSATAEHAGAAAEQAAQEIQDAQDRANAAAQAMFDAESEIDTLDLQIADTEQRVAELDAQVGAMRTTLQDRAVQRFTQGATGENPLFTPVDHMNDVAAADVYAGIATGSALASVDDFESAISELDDL